MKTSKSSWQLLTGSGAPPRQRWAVPLSFAGTAWVTLTASLVWPVATGWVAVHSAVVFSVFVFVAAFAIQNARKRQLVEHCRNEVVVRMSRDCGRRVCCERHWVRLSAGVWVEFYHLKLQEENENDNDSAAHSERQTAKWKESTKRKADKSEHSQCNETSATSRLLAASSASKHTADCVQTSDNSADGSEDNCEERNLCYVMIPGNPGIAAAYIHMLTCVLLSPDNSSSSMDAEELSESDFDCDEVIGTATKSDATNGAISHINFKAKPKISSALVISHTNHTGDSGNQNGGRLFGLRAQIRHKCQWLESLLTADLSSETSDEWANGIISPTTDVILGGHSIGAYIVLHCMHWLSGKPVTGGSDMHSTLSGRVKQLHLWTPTIEDIGLSPNAQFFTPIIDKIVNHLTPVTPLDDATDSDKLYSAIDAVADGCTDDCECAEFNEKSADDCSDDEKRESVSDIGKVGLSLNGATEMRKRRTHKIDSEKKERAKVPSAQKPQLRRGESMKAALVKTRMQRSSRSLSTAFHRGVVPSLALLCQCVPGWFVSHNVCCFHKLKADIACANGRLLSNVVSMASDEFHYQKKVAAVNSLNDRGDFRVGQVLVAFAQRTHYCWAQNDKWAPDSIRNSVQSWLKSQSEIDSSVYFDNHWILADDWLKHDFVICDPVEGVEAKLTDILFRWAKH